MKVLISFQRMYSISSSRLSRFRSATSPVIKEIGHTFPIVPTATYEPGQIFIHRTFAYKGVVVCSFSCRLHEKIEDTTEKQVTMRDYYQVLVHRHDWGHMGFPVDMTSYLVDSANNRGEKLLTLINGMDCVGHDDIIPYSPLNSPLFVHDLFDRIFDARNDNGVMSIRMKPELLDSYRSSHRSWLAPRDVYKEKTENIEVTVTTFYLGTNTSAGQLQFLWRYVVRIENLKPEQSVILRERCLKIYSLNNMNQMHGHGVIGKVWRHRNREQTIMTRRLVRRADDEETRNDLQQPELNVATPAFQFSSTIELKHSKGGHMWGRFKMERENGVSFDVQIPTVVLESTDDDGDAATPPPSPSSSAPTTTDKPLS